MIEIEKEGIPFLSGRNRTTTNYADDIPTSEFCLFHLLFALTPKLPDKKEQGMHSYT